MANPPMTIGEITTVPTPESPINASFHQTMANRVVHRFANATALDAWAAGNGSLAFVTSSGTLYVRRSGSWWPLALQSSLDTTNTNLGNAPLGIIQHKVGTDVGQSCPNNVTTLLTGCSITWTATAGRYYRTTVTVPTCINAQAFITIQCQITDGASAPLREQMQSQSGANFNSFHFDNVESNLSGSITRRLMMRPVGASLVIGDSTGDTRAYRAPTITVEDLGAV